MKKCDIRQYSTMEKCETCGSCWDVNDPYPPDCILMESYEKTKPLDWILIIYLFFIGRLLK